MMKKKWYILIFIAIVIFWIVYTNINITVTKFTIKNDQIPNEFDRFKIAHISDLHNHQWGNKLIKKLKRENPDIIAITGDLVDSSNTNFEVASQFIADARKIAPIYYVTGNHEAWIGDQFNTLKDILEENSVFMMDNKSLFIEKGTDRIKIIGIQDPEFNSISSYGVEIKEEVSTVLGRLIDEVYLSTE